MDLRRPLRKWGDDHQSNDSSTSGADKSANGALGPKADIGQLNDLTGGGSFSVEARADAAILVAERERVATE